MIAKGASLGFKLALAYGIVFVLAAAVRYGSDLIAAPPNGNLWLTYLAGVTSLAVAALGIALIFGLVAAVVGALTGLLAGAIDRWLNAGHRPQRAAAIGLSVAGVIVLLLHSALWSAGLWSSSSLASSTYLFWLGAPTLIYLASAYQTGRANS